MHREQPISRNKMLIRQPPHSQIQPQRTALRMVRQSSMPLHQRPSSGTDQVAKQQPKPQDLLRNTCQCMYDTSVRKDHRTQLIVWRVRLCACVETCSSKEEFSTLSRTTQAKCQTLKTLNLVRTALVIDDEIKVARQSECARRCWSCCTVLLDTVQVQLQAKERRAVDCDHRGEGIAVAGQDQ